MTTPFRKVDGLMQVSPAQNAQATVTVPGSKSLTNRYLLLAGLAAGETRLVNPLHSDDTVYMRESLQAIGCTITESDGVWVINAPESWHAPKQQLFIGNAGTAMRFLTPALAAQPIASRITGNERMLVRPIGDLVDGLLALGANIDYEGEAGYPPLRLNQPMKPGVIDIRGDASSQYLSGLLMALPTLPGDSEIRVTTELVSRTYVEMTLDCMSRMGVEVESNEAFDHFRIPGNQSYRAQEIIIEPDASTASYWFALPLMVGGEVVVRDVPETSHQGDFGLLDIFEQMGVSVKREDGLMTISAPAPLRGVDVDMNTRSDVAPTLAVVATLADSPTTIRNIANMRIKECDRIACIQEAFDALGLKMENGPDWMKIYPSTPTRAAVLNPEDDHRMAMIFALLGLRHGGVTIQDPECVGKTYPNFYEDIARAF